MVINKKWSEADILADALGERSLRDGADWLNEKLPVDYQRTHATLNNWLYDVYPIPFPWIEALVRYYPEGDERHALGLKLIEKHGVSPVYLAGNWNGNSHTKASETRVSEVADAGTKPARLKA